MIDKKDRRVMPGSVPDKGENQGGQQGESQSPAPQRALRGEEGNGDKARTGQPGETKPALPPFNTGVGKGGGDNPHNPGGRRTSKSTTAGR